MMMMLLMMTIMAHDSNRNKQYNDRLGGFGMKLIVETITNLNAVGS